MKTVTNKTKRPLKIRLPQGKTLFLGPTKKGQVRDEALEHPPVKKLIEAGDLEVDDLGSQQYGGGGGTTSGKGAKGHGGGPSKTSSGDR